MQSPLTNLKSLLLPVLKISQISANAVLEVYNSSDFEVEIKKDKSPLTRADKLSHDIIFKQLERLTPDIAILSEEGANIPYDQRKLWRNYWLIDPIDGTKEFINRNGEFTINIALIDQAQPVLGVVFAPAKGLLYYALSGFGAYRFSLGKDINEYDSLEDVLAVSQKLPVIEVNDPLVVSASRSHKDENLKTYLENLKNSGYKTKVISAGSSLKLCMVAEGTADIYPRFGPTMEWDIAAGHCVVKESLARVLTGENCDLAYNKKTLKNDSFIAFGETCPSFCVTSFFK